MNRQGTGRQADVCLLNNNMESEDDRHDKDQGL